MLTLVPAAGPAGWANAADAEVVSKPLPMGLVIRLGPGKLTNVIDWGESDRGQDEAANLYATAMRIKTEYALGQRDVQLVGQLDEWRVLLLRCRCTVWDIESIQAGGGTMWGHNSAREVAPVEDFLAGLAARIPLARGKGSKEATKLLDKAVAHVKALEVHSDAKEKLRVAAKAYAVILAELQAKLATLSKVEAERITRFVVEDVMTVEKAGAG